MAPLKKSYVNFVDLPTKGVTRAWFVFPIMGARPIGRVKWHAPWRRYCFFPEADTLYDAACLDEIAGFCNRQMNLRKMSREADRLARKETA
jgi:hypothetical protein